VVQTIDIAMIFMLGVVVASSRYAQFPALIASMLSIAIFDFCFVPPYYTFSVSDANYTLTFGVMLVVALLVSRLTARIRLQAEAARERESVTAALYAMSRELGAARSAETVSVLASHHLQRTFEGQVVILLPDENGNLVVQHSTGPSPDDKEMGVARWVFDHSRMAGQGTSTLPSAGALYLPLISSGTTIGVIGTSPTEPHLFTDPIQRQLLETFAGQAAVALQRAMLAEHNQRTQVEVEAERLRTSLLSSLSHDLRTPLASIEGAASSLLNAPATVHPDTRHDLAQTILEESRRMTRLVANLLDMVRVETGALQLKREWQLLEEVIGIVLIRLDERLKDHPVRVHLPADLPLVPIDGVLMEQVFLNLLENAIKYTPPDTPITISAAVESGNVIVSVADEGPGIRMGEEERVFDKFHRIAPDTSSGVGLGLTICRGIVKAHGGRIWLEHAPSGGAIFRFSLPLGTEPPPVPEVVESVERA
jgi:two-component system sensor histidine kinase KdpD